MGTHFKINNDMKNEYTFMLVLSSLNNAVNIIVDLIICRIY